MDVLVLGLHIFEASHWALPSLVSYLTWKIPPRTIRSFMDLSIHILGISWNASLKFMKPSGKQPQFAVENCHLVRWFSHEKWWFSIAMLVYQRVNIIHLQNTMKTPSIFSAGCSLKIRHESGEACEGQGWEWQNGADSQLTHFHRWSEEILKWAKKCYNMLQYVTICYNMLQYVTFVKVKL